MNFRASSHDVLTSCPCRGLYDGRRREHYVWIAFLHYDNDESEYRPSDEGTWASFVNYATCVLDWSSIFHCQAFFYDHDRRTFVTFSVDAARNRVFSSDRKRFSRGWTFVRLRVSADEELAMYNFLVRQEQAGARFNAHGARLVLIRPVDTRDGSFFCSQLVVAAFQAAGLLAHVRPYAVSPAALYALVHAEWSADVRVESENPVRA